MNQVTVQHENSYFSTVKLPALDMIIGLRFITLIEHEGGNTYIRFGDTQYTLRTVIDNSKSIYIELCRVHSNWIESQGDTSQVNPDYRTQLMERVDSSMASVVGRVEVSVHNHAISMIESVGSDLKAVSSTLRTTTTSITTHSKQLKDIADHYAAVLDPNES